MTDMHVTPPGRRPVRGDHPMSGPQLPPPCFVCGRELKQAFTEADENMPLGATAFDGRGNYGSGLHDPAGLGFAIELNICDACLAANRSRVVERHTITIVNFEYRPWRES